MLQRIQKLLKFVMTSMESSLDLESSKSLKRSLPMQSKVFHCGKEADAVAVIAANLSSFLCLICQPKCKSEPSLPLFQKVQLVKVRFCIL